MKRYKVSISDYDGLPDAWTGIKVIDLRRCVESPCALLEAEYLFMLRAKELFRDTLFHEGLWDQYVAQRERAKTRQAE